MKTKTFLNIQCRRTKKDLATFWRLKVWKTMADKLMDVLHKHGYTYACANCRTKRFKQTDSA